MKLITTLFRMSFYGFIILGITLAACAPQGTPSASELATHTPAASLTPTIEWFPPTPTLSLPPTQTPETQAQSLPGTGSLIYSDTFNDPALWQSDTAQGGNIAFGQGKLTLAVLAAKGTLQTFRRDPVVSDFYAEVTVTANLCQGDDIAGLLFRTNASDSYRFLIDCNGRTTAQVVINGAPTPMQDWTASGELLAGLPAPVKLGVWASRNTLRFFINDQFQFEVERGVYLSGGIGLYARAASDNPLSVSFAKLAVYQISDASHATTTPQTTPQTTPSLQTPTP